MEEEAEKMQKLEDGEESCEMLTSRHNMAIVYTNS